MPKDQFHPIRDELTDEEVMLLHPDTPTRKVPIVNVEATPPSVEGSPLDAAVVAAADAAQEGREK